MPAPELIRRADVLVQHGRRRQAIRELRDALANEPGQPDVQAKLVEIEIEPKSPSAGTIIHLCMSWVFLFGPLLLLVPVSPWLRRFMDGAFTDELNPVWAVCLGLLFAAVWGVFAGTICLHLWFLYLKHVSGGNRAEVESRIHHFVAVAHFEPYYSRVRSRYISDQK